MINDEPTIEDDPSLVDPFRQVFGHSFYYVDAAAGKQKTRTAIRYAIAETRVGNKTMFAMPTVKLIKETIERTIPEIAKQMGVKVQVHVITKEFRTYKSIAPSVPEAICEFIGKEEEAQILFVTHEGMLRVVEWPEQVKDWHIIIDEVFDPILSSGVLKLRYSSFNLGRPVELDRGFGFVRALPLNTTLGDEKSKDEYYHIVPILNPNNPNDPWHNIRLHNYSQDHDQVYEIFKQVPLWLLQKEALFTHVNNWDRMTTGVADGKTTMRKGYFTISGFRRPDRLLGFRRVTIMSALFESTMLHNLWSRLGIEFKPSPDISVSGNTTSLGSRLLRIGWLTDAIWSKRSRDKSGGIEIIFQVIGESGIIDDKQGVGIVVNKDDQALIEARSAKSLDLLTTLRKYFPKRELLPHNVRGSNMWTHLHQLIHTAALNSNATDILWIERALGIDSVTQRVARVGHEIYQTFMRLSIRLPEGEQNLILVVMEKMIADWVVQHFVPEDQIEIIEIDGQGRVAKPKANGRPKTNSKPLKEQVAENMRKYRARKKAEKNKTV